MMQLKTRSTCSLPKSSEKKYECPKCNDSGWELKRIDEDGNEIYGNCSCGIRNRRIAKGRRNFSQIPEVFKDSKISNFDSSVYEKEDSKKLIEASLKAVNYWLENFEEMKNRGMGLYISSVAKGSGKTKMAASIANELVEKGILTLFATSVDILSAIKSTWTRDSETTEEKLINNLLIADVLILDDFGTEKETGWVNEKFYQIINSRYTMNKITIFTSNTKINNLNYDERIINRVKERTFQIPFPEESIREIIAKVNMREILNKIKE